VGHKIIFDGSHLRIIEIECVLQVKPLFENAVGSSATKVIIHSLYSRYVLEIIVKWKSPRSLICCCAQHSIT